MNRESEGKSGGIPHLAKNERDVGHPSMQRRARLKPSPGYINSSINPRATSGGMRELCLTSGSALSTGSDSCRVGTSVRSKNLPMGISSPHSSDFSIAPIQLVESYEASSSSFFTRGRNHWNVLSWL